MYFFMRGVVDYQSHLMLKDSCTSMQEQILINMSQEEQANYLRLFELNYNYWHNFNECEKRIYDLIIQMEKEISMDNLLDIFNSYFDLNLMKEELSDKVNLLKNNASMD